MTENKDSKETLKYLGLWLLFSIGYFAFWRILCCHDSITYDSSYQYFLNCHSYKGIFELLPKDYSPPLYSLGLKTFSLIFGGSLVSLRMFSACLMSLLFLTVLFPLRRLLGKETAVLSAILLFTSSYNLFFGVEIRPTVLAYVISTATIIYAGLVFFEEKKSDLIIFTILALGSMYTHNVSLIFAFCIYGVCIIASLVKKDKKLFLKFLISGITVAILYIPWLFVLLGQFGNVVDYFWRDTDSLMFGFYIAFVGFMENKLPSFVSYIILLAIVLIPFINVFLLIDTKKLKTAGSITELISKKDVKEKWPNLKRVLFIVGIPVVSMIFFYVVTVTAVPIFAVRYLYIFAGSGTIAVASLFCLCKGKKVPAIVIAVLMTAVFVSNFVTEKKFLDTTTKDEFVEDIMADSGNDPVFIHFDEQSLGVISYTFPDSRHYVCDQTDSVLQTFDVFTTDIRYLHKADEIWNETDVVYIFNAVNFEAYSTLDPVEYYLYYFDDKDITIEEVGRYHLPYADEIGYNYGENIVFRVTKN